MPFVLLILAIAALAAGVALLWWDQRQRTTHPTVDAADSTIEPELEPQPEPLPEPEYEPTPEPEAAPEPTPEPAPVTPDSDPAEEATDDATEEPLPAPRFAERAERAKHLVPGSARRERKAFGQQRGWDYAKHDSYLADEWTRGAAARGQEPKDIVAGTVRGGRARSAAE